MAEKWLHFNWTAMTWILFIQVLMMIGHHWFINGLARKLTPIIDIYCLDQLSIFWFETQIGAPGFIEDYHILFNIVTLHIALSLYNKLPDAALYMYVYVELTIRTGTQWEYKQCWCVSLCVCVCVNVCVRHQSVNVFVRHQSVNSYQF